MLPTSQVRVFITIITLCGLIKQYVFLLPVKRVRTMKQLLVSCLLAQLLLLSFLGSLLDSSLLSNTDHSSVSSLYSELGVGSEVLHVVGDGDHLQAWALLGERHDVGSGELVGGGVSLLCLSGLAWEQDQLALVLFQALDVVLERLEGLVRASVVDGDTDGWGNLDWDAGLLELLVSETLSESHLGVVADGLGANLWAKGTRDWPWEGGSGLGSTSFPSADLSTRLVEPCHHVSSPPLVEMPVWHNVVMTNHSLLGTVYSSQTKTKVGRRSSTHYPH